MQDYGVRVYRQGIVFHPDNRRRDLNGQAFRVPVRVSRFQKRGAIKAWSTASARRMAFVCANVAMSFRSILTLTYRAPVESWETDEDRNFRIVRNCKDDLNRFLSCLRRELGGYFWVQEFQARGVVHFHVLCEREIGENRVRLAWCRAIDAIGDEHALRHGVKVEVIRSEDAARSYLARYVGKEKQKNLPPGVDGSGRWWGASRSLQLKMLNEMVACDQEGQEHHPMVLYVMRNVRRYLRRKLGFKFRGGSFVDWGGRLAEVVAEMMEELRRGYMGQAEAWVAKLEKRGWEVSEEMKWPWIMEEPDRTGSCTCADDASG